MPGVPLLKRAILAGVVLALAFTATALGTLSNPRGHDVTAVAGTQFTAVVADFDSTRQNSSPPSNFSATIDWGDGTSSSGTFVPRCTMGCAMPFKYDVQGTHTYASGGSYTITTTITDPMSTLPATAQSTATVAPGPPPPPGTSAPPTAAFDPPADLRVGLPTRFSAIHSTGSGLSYRWEFGGQAADGGSSHTIDHKFDAPGNVNVRLTVTDDKGRQASVAHDVHVARPTDAVLEMKPARPKPGQTVKFTVTTTTDPQNKIDLYTWTFGDGKPGDADLGQLRFPGVHPTTKPATTHTFAKAGRYKVQVDAVGHDGQVRTVGGEVTVAGSSKARKGSAQSAARSVAHPCTFCLGFEFSENPATVNPFTIETAVPEICVPEAAQPKQILKYGGEQESIAIGQGRRGADVRAAKSCEPQGAYRIVKVTWGDGTSTAPNDGSAFGTADLAEYRSTHAIQHVYDKPGNYAIVVTVRFKGSTKNDINAAPKVHVVEAWCNPLYVNGLAATLADDACWVPIETGTDAGKFVAPGGARIVVGGLKITGDKPSNGGDAQPVAVAGLKQNQPGPGTFATLDPKRPIRIFYGGTQVGASQGFAIPAAPAPATVKDLLGKFTVQGLPVLGGDVRFDRGGGPAILDANLQLPADIPETPRAPLTEEALTNPAAPIDVPPLKKASLGKLEINGLSLEHNEKGWFGGLDLNLSEFVPINVAISAPSDPATESGIGIDNDGGLMYIGAKATLEPGVLQIANTFSLDQFGFKAATHPTRFEGSILLNTLPPYNIFGGTPLVTVNGAIAMAFREGTGKTFPFCTLGGPKTLTDSGEGLTLKACGNVAVLGIPAADGYFQLDTPPVSFSFGTTINYDIAGLGLLSIQGGASGAFADPKVWQTQVDGAKICEDLVGHECAGGTTFALSSRGVAGCIDLFIAEIGGYVRWSDNAYDFFFRSCGSKAPAQVKVLKPVGPLERFAKNVFDAQLGPITTVSVPKTAQQADYHMFAISGQGKAPLVKVTSPSGARSFVDNGSPKQKFGTGRYNGILRSERLDTTYVYARKPSSGDSQAGKWKIQAREGSVPITQIRSTDGLSKPQVSAALESKGGTKQLTFNSGDPNQQINFVEQSAGRVASVARAGGSAAAPVSRVVAHASAARRRGKIRFRPAEGLGRKRELVAQVSLDGIPWKNVTVARYTAPAPFVPAKPRKVRARVVKGGLAVTWRGVRGAKGYRVMASLGDGRVVSFRTSRRGVRIPGYIRTLGATVTVQAVGANLRSSPVAKLRVKAGRPAPLSL